VGISGTFFRRETARSDRFSVDANEAIAYFKLGSVKRTLRQWLMETMMDKLKGRFINMAGLAMALYTDQRDKADELLKSEIGKSYKDLEPDGWYDLRIFIRFLEAYAAASATGQEAYVTAGRRVFSTAKGAGVLPASLSTPREFLEFEFELYLMSIEGPNIHPRKLLHVSDGEVRIEVRNPPYLAFDKLMEGVFLGAVQMSGVKSAKVEQTKCAQRGDDLCEYRITW
jgi:uncharacterized protein (TIGR02265 family)